MKPYINICIILLLSFVAINPASATLINGGFEEPAIEAGKAEDFNRVPGWNLRSGEKAIIHRDFEPAEGKQFIEIDGDVFGDIYQQASTTSGLTYNLDFFYSLPLLPNGKGIPGHANSDTAGAFGFTLGAGDFESDFDFQIVEMLVTGGKKLEEPDWQPYSIRFEARAASTTIMFFDQAKSGYLIDGASLTAVPEPATVLLLAIGLVGLVGVERKKSKESQ